MVFSGYFLISMGSQSYWARYRLLGGFPDTRLRKTVDGVFCASSLITGMRWTELQNKKQRPNSKKCPRNVQKLCSRHFADIFSQQTGVYPYPLGAGSARPNPKKGAPDTENPITNALLLPSRENTGFFGRRACRTKLSPKNF